MTYESRSSAGPKVGDAGRASSRPKKPRWPRAKFEGTAVAYAMLILKGWPSAGMNERIIAEHGIPMLLRVKRRAWQHVRGQAPSRPDGTTSGERKQSLSQGEAPDA